MSEINILSSDTSSGQLVHPSQIHNRRQTANEHSYEAYSPKPPYGEAIKKSATTFKSQQGRNSLGRSIERNNERARAALDQQPEEGTHLPQQN